MTPRSVLLFSLVLFSVFCTASTPMCNYKCCLSVEGFPVRLRKLREDLTQTTDYCDSQSCCFLHLLLRFYVERVHSSCVSSQPQQQYQHFCQHQETHTPGLPTEKMDNFPGATDTEGH